MLVGEGNKLVKTSTSLAVVLVSTLDTILLEHNNSAAKM